LSLSSGDLKLMAASIYPTDVPEKKEKIHLENTGLDTEMDSPETSDPSTSPPVTESSTAANVSKDSNFGSSLHTSSTKRPSSSPPSRPEQQDTQRQPIRRSESHEMSCEELTPILVEEKNDSKDLVKESDKEEEEEMADYTYALEDDFSFSESLRSYSESRESTLHAGTLPFALNKVSTASRLRTDRTELSHPSELSIRTFTRTDSESVQSATLPIRPEFGGLLTSEDLSQRSLRHMSKIIRKNEAHQPIFEARGTKGSQKPERKLSEKTERKTTEKFERLKPAEPPTHLPSLSKVSVALGKGSKKTNPKDKGKEVQSTEKEKSRSIFSFKSLPQKKSADELRKKESEDGLNFLREESHDSKKTEDLRPRKKKLSSSTAPLMSEQTQIILGVHLTPDCVLQPINPDIRPQMPNDMLLPCLPEIRQKAFGGDVKK
jgi:hypothetical protein